VSEVENISYWFNTDASVQQIRKIPELPICSTDLLNISYAAHIMACTSYLLSIEAITLQYRPNE
jgi:hypothetical protein